MSDEDVSAGEFAQARTGALIDPHRPRLRASRPGAKLSVTMIHRQGSDTVELECPECGATVKTTAKEAEEGVLRCPRGHEFAVMGMLGGGLAKEP